MTERKQTIDPLDYLLITRIYDRYPGETVTIYDPSGTVALMGKVPHDASTGDVRLRLKPGVLMNDERPD